jgi:hypothetical protein
MPAITINRPRDAVERQWRSDARSADMPATFADAPGDRGTEIHVKLEGRVKSAQRAKVMDHLRRFKQKVETGVIARSDAAPEGELAERKLKQRPAQPLPDTEAERVNA